MKIIVTGATGSLGGVITRHFATSGHSVIATGRVAKPPTELLKYAKYIQADITKPYSLPKADVCIHAAALSDDKAQLKDLLITNELGTQNTLEAARDCKKFIHISSSSVYLPSNVSLKEDVAGKQNNKQLSAYGFSKLKSEEIIRKNFAQKTCFILRPRALYGVGDKMILPRILKLEKNGCIKHPGSMEINISLTHYTNLMQAIDCCLVSDKTGIHTYNVADEQKYVFIDVIRKITQALYGKKLNEKQVPISVIRMLSWFKINGITPLLVRSFTQDMTLDISKIQKELHYKTVIDLEDSLNELQKWVNSIGGVSVLKTGAKHLAWL